MPSLLQKTAYFTYKSGLRFRLAFMDLALTLTHQNRVPCTHWVPLDSKMHVMYYPERKQTNHIWRSISSHETFHFPEMLPKRHWYCNQCISVLFYMLSLVHVFYFSPFQAALIQNIWCWDVVGIHSSCIVPMSEWNLALPSLQKKQLLFSGVSTWSAYVSEHV